MSAETIQFISQPRRRRDDTDFPTIAFRSALPDDARPDPLDTAPSEYLPSDWQEK
ncbi:hypothetical protein JQ604_30700 [Bradyrhizobium jicamae]|uniref:hypothetical protein n=1 Tax=Bradyrhizobium jicamae TaxID=280332 RepID=UPI001BABCF55|nr:hypothetical protein [Bradyrhizobium jicamae]MBR0756570.1 hypothetical protein [Bradyrhizobium jicamae]